MDPSIRSRQPAALAVALTVAGALFAGCTFDEGALKDKGMYPLTGPEVQAILAKARYRWEAAGGASGTAVTTPDGRMRMMWETGAANGRIRFTKTGYCSRFDGIRGGAEDCYKLYRTGPSQYTVFKDDGTHSGRITVESP
ncbi:MAG: hypothetical protein AB7G13_33235 [Lautropia sp.]